MNAGGKQLRRRYRSERRLALLGLAAIAASLLFLLGLIASVAGSGWRALQRAEIMLPVHFDPERIGADGGENVLAYSKLTDASLQAAYPELASKRKGRKELKELVSFGAALKLKGDIEEGRAAVGDAAEAWLPASSRAEAYLKGAVERDADGKTSGLSENQVRVLDELRAAGAVRLRFNDVFFFAGDSRDPELAGIGGALAGSALTLLVAFVISFPIAIGSAIYLELLAPRNRFFDIIEININNLAAVPSIIKGLLGLAVLINFVGVPRSSVLAGGLVLTLLTLPTIIIAARASLKSVPPSLLEGALSLGATRLQGIMHQVLPVAMPGVMTGTIIGMAHALGETAPLLMIGMVAFVVAVPSGLTDVATVLPVQIYLWSDSPERGFVERTALAICVLLAFLFVMNASAIYLRKRFEKYK